MSYSDDRLFAVGMGLSHHALFETSRMRKRINYDAFSDEEWVPESAGEDRLSCLTDELLHSIMSFMNTKCAVQTCVLSKRWVSLWRSLPYLDFNHVTFPFKGDPGVGEVPEEEDPDKIIAFNNFIAQMLFRRRHTNLVKVRLNVRLCNESQCTFMVEGLIAYALDHNVQELIVLWNYGRDFVLPESFYTCQSLATLYVHRTARLPKFLALPALKSLHIHYVRMSGSFLHPRNFSGCPNLETLILSSIWLQGEDTTLFINAPKLKRLKITCEQANKKHRCYGCKVVIDAPRLTTFWYSGYAPIVCSSDDLTSIDDVYFNVYNKYISRDGEEFVDMCFDIRPDYVLRLVNSIKEFRHVKSLMLSLDTVEALSTFPSLLDENRLSFANLEYLKIKLRLFQSHNEVEIPLCVLNFFLNNSTKFKLC